jgi:hypothetical protein
MMSRSRFCVWGLQLVAALAMLPLGFVVVSWFAAQSPRENHNIPADWPAGVPNHGEYYRWPFGTIHDSPIAFSVCLLLLIMCVLFLIYSGLRASGKLRVER